MAEIETERRTHLRNLWRSYWRAIAAQRAEWEATDHSYRDALSAWRAGDSFTRCPIEPRRPASLAFLDKPRGLTCGAKTRTGTPCKRIDLFGKADASFMAAFRRGRAPMQARPFPAAIRNEPHDRMVNDSADGASAAASAK